ncbi:MAG: MmgE/PrpD family protein [Alphaproteobacteria bacterium]|nr:MmgE/PrpD family protein [Alphaproteobacteria bacterium]
MSTQSQAPNFNQHDAQLSAVVDWLARTRPTADSAVADRARLLLLDTLGCAIAGLRREPVATYAGRLAGEEGVRCPGFPTGLNPSHFGQVMALAACWDEACEGLAAAHGRPGLHAVPAALALALDRGASLAETLDAIVVGYEVGGRLGAAWRIRGGMHVDGTWGIVAAAASAAALLNGRAGGVVGAAVEAAACMIPASLYAPVRQGATTRNLYAGQAVSRGIETALAIASGITAPRQAISEAAALTFDPTQASALTPPGTWLILQGYFKPFAAVRHVHYGVQAALDWRAQHGAGTADITAIRLQTYPEAATYCGNRAPATAIQAQFSLTYGLAHALVRGSLGPEAYDPEALADDVIRRLEDIVLLDDTGQFQTGRGANLTITAHGAKTSVSVDRVEGDPLWPMAAASVVDKFGRIAGRRLGPSAAAELAARIMDEPIDRPLASILTIP